MLLLIPRERSVRASKVTEGGDLTELTEEKTWSELLVGSKLEGEKLMCNAVLIAISEQVEFWSPGRSLNNIILHHFVCHFTEHCFLMTLIRKKKKKDSRPGHCLRGFSPGTLVSFHVWEPCTGGELVRVHCPRMGGWVWGPLRWGPVLPRWVPALRLSVHGGPRHLRPWTGIRGKKIILLVLINLS